MTADTRSVRARSAALELPRTIRGLASGNSAQPTPESTIWALPQPVPRNFLCSPLRGSVLSNEESRTRESVDKDGFNVRLWSAHGIARAHANRCPGLIFLI